MEARVLITIKKISRLYNCYARKVACNIKKVQVQMAPEATITAAEYLQKLREDELEASKALPYSFDECTNEKGHIRQKIYACMTCGAGVCYSCAIICHEDHELIDLGDRTLTCDCGTKRCGTLACKLKNNISGLPENSLNVYDKSFENKFCYCSRPADENQTMYQCLLCDDWFHEKCLTDVPQDESGIHDCINKCSEEDDKNVDSETQQHASISSPPESECCSTEGEIQGIVCKDCLNKYDWMRRYAGLPGFPCGSTVSRLKSEKEAKADTDEEHDGKRIKTGNCLWATLQDNPYVKELFLTDSFRETLCGCKECIEHRNKSHSYIYEEPETYSPPLDDDATSSIFDLGAKALERMDRAQAVEGIKGYLVLKEKVTGFLDEFVKDKKEVTEADVRTFFDTMQQQLKK